VGTKCTRYSKIWKFYFSVILGLRKSRAVLYPLCLHGMLWEDLFELQHSLAYHIITAKLVAKCTETSIDDGSSQKLN
jgi:hypothetical protein